jgi:hydrogenase maturation protein HypF
VNRHSLLRAEHEPRRRLRLDVTGAVQGVGFRPFVHRLAVSEGLGGFVRNTSAGVSLEVEGSAQALDRFLARLDGEIRPPAGIHARQAHWLPLQGERDFAITPSTSTGRCSAVVLPDLATCPACLKEIADPDDRRYRYPFTTCVHCGPRYSIIEAVPYDRARTTMRRFPMCAACQAEYDDPSSRRFHVEANACPDCGPRIALWDSAGNVLATGHQALAYAADAIRQGRIVALKGLGGFQLVVDARNDAAVRGLRDRKRRPAKPFAIMVPSLADAAAVANLSRDEEQLLCSSAAPIVLLRARLDSNLVARSVAPSNPLLGIMLPYTPLHHLLMDALGIPIVATSGNQSGEPIVADEDEALRRLKGCADVFLVHDRPILRPVDDSVVRMMAGHVTVLRLARGYAPLPLAAPSAGAPRLAVGGYQKNAVAIAVGRQVILGPHIGDLDEAETRTAFMRAVEGLASLYCVHPDVIACDQHPDYFSTRLADQLGPLVRRVPHHLAHVLAGVLDNGLDGPVLGVAWDGTGYGSDGTIWGGEFLKVDRSGYRRAAHLLSFRLPGGELAVREPRRAAFGALYAVFGEEAFAMTDIHPVTAFAPAERQVLARMLTGGVNSPLTSSAGRLFDAVAAVLGFHQKASFEGQAAMAVEFAAGRAANAASLPTPAMISDEAACFVIDWRPMLQAMVNASREGIPAENLAAGFHEGLVDAIVAAATRIGIAKVLLTGGCFQNARLTERAVVKLRQAGFAPYWHARVPPNDGGLAVGQAAFAARPLIEENR